VSDELLLEISWKFAVLVWVTTVFDLKCINESAAKLLPALLVKTPSIMAAGVFQCRAVGSDGLNAAL
jgi:hypothetical protein